MPHGPRECIRRRTGNSSSQLIRGAGAHIAGPVGSLADVLTSHGNISVTAPCPRRRTVIGRREANVGPPDTGCTRSGSSTPRPAVRSQSVNQNSTVLNIGGTGLPIPARCATGTANTNFTPLSPLLSACATQTTPTAARPARRTACASALTLFALVTASAHCSRWAPLVRRATLWPQQQHHSARWGNPGGNGGTAVRRQVATTAASGAGNGGGAGEQRPRSRNGLAR